MITVGMRGDEDSPMADAGGRDAYKQIVLFPVQAMANLHDLYYSVAMNRYLAFLGDKEANHWAERAVRCFERDSLLCRDYNKVMAGGKWDGMMDEVHIGYNRRSITYLSHKDTTSR